MQLSKLANRRNSDARSEAKKFKKEDRVKSIHTPQLIVIAANWEIRRCTSLKKGCK
jgi:hypothetical protein